MEKKGFTIGAPILVKDEIRCIDRMLDTIVGRLDQIVIMDTGSTDGTLERLRQWESVWPSITVVEEPWDGSFSSMRNKVQAYMTTDFLFIIDADEWMPIPNRGTSKDPWTLIERAIQEQGDFMDCGYIKLYNHLPKGQTVVGDSVDALRIVHNRPEIKWEGRVHNQMQRSIAKNPRDGKGIKISHIIVVLEHDGYNLHKPDAVEKYTKRLPLMIAEIKHQQDVGNTSLEAYYQFQLANGYYICDLLPEAMEGFKKLKYDNLENHNKYNAALIAVATAMRLENKFEMQVWSERLMELAPSQPIVLTHRANVLRKLGQPLDAYPYIAAAIALNREPSIDKTHFLDEAYCAGLAAELCLELEMYNEAVVYARIVTNTYPNHIRMKEIDRQCTTIIYETLKAAFGGDGDVKEVPLEEKPSG
jgi:tetratricopeptide (TPR) repeat protein